MAAGHQEPVHGEPEVVGRPAVPTAGAVLPGVERVHPTGHVVEHVAEPEVAVVDQLGGDALAVHVGQPEDRVVEAVPVDLVRLLHLRQAGGPALRAEQVDRLRVDLVVLAQAAGAARGSAPARYCDQSSLGTPACESDETMISLSSMFSQSRPTARRLPHLAEARLQFRIEWFGNRREHLAERPHRRFGTNVRTRVLDGLVVPDDEVAVAPLVLDARAPGRRGARTTRPALPRSLPVRAPRSRASPAATRTTSCDQCAGADAPPVVVFLGWSNTESMTSSSH